MVSKTYDREQYRSWNELHGFGVSRQCWCKGKNWCWSPLTVSSSLNSRKWRTTSRHEGCGHWVFGLPTPKSTSAIVKQSAKSDIQTAKWPIPSLRSVYMPRKYPGWWRDQGKDHADREKAFLYSDEALRSQVPAQRRPSICISRSTQAFHFAGVLVGTGRGKEGREKREKERVHLSLLSFRGSIWRREILRRIFLPICAPNLYLLFILWTHPEKSSRAIVRTLEKNYLVGYKLPAITSRSTW